MRVAEIMTEDPSWVETTTTVGEAAAKLDDTDIRHLPVLEDGVVVGIVSDRDLRTTLPGLDTFAVDPEGFGRALGTPIGDVMTRTVATVEPDRDVKDAVDLMIKHHIGAVVVVDPESNRLAGIASYVDVLRAIRDMVWG